MNTEHASAGITAHRDAPPAHAHGRRLFLARVAWLGIALLTVGLLVAAIPRKFALLRTVCEGAHAACSERLAAAGARALAGLGLSLDIYAAYYIALDVSFVAVALAVSAVIARRGGRAA